MNIFDRELLKAAAAFGGFGQPPPIAGPVGPVKGAPPVKGPKIVTPGARAAVKSRLAEKLGPRMQPDVFGKGTEPSTTGKAPASRPVPTETRQAVEKSRRVKELESQKAEQAKGKEARVSATKERRAAAKAPVPAGVLPAPAAAASGATPPDIFGKGVSAPVRTQASPSTAPAPAATPAPSAPPVANTAVPGSEAPAQPAVQPAAQPGAAPFLNWKRKLMLGGGLAAGLAAGAGLYAGYKGIQGFQRGSAEGEEERRRRGLP